LELRAGGVRQPWRLRVGKQGREGERWATGWGPPAVRERGVKKRRWRRERGGQVGAAASKEEMEWRLAAGRQGARALGLGAAVVACWA
jgi:hypothetical protein